MVRPWWPSVIPSSRVVNGLTSAAQAVAKQALPGVTTKLNEARFSPDGRLAVLLSLMVGSCGMGCVAGAPLSALKVLKMGNFREFFA